MAETKRRKDSTIIKAERAVRHAEDAKNATRKKLAARKTAQ